MTAFCDHQSRAIDLQKRCQDLRAKITELENSLQTSRAEEHEEKAMAASVLQKILSQGDNLKAHLQGSDTLTFIEEGEFSETRQESLEQMTVRLRQKLLVASARESPHQDQATLPDGGNGTRRESAASSWRPDYNNDSNTFCPYFNDREGCLRQERDCWRLHRCHTCKSTLHGSYECQARGY